MMRKIVLGLLGLMVVVALVLAGCKSGGEAILDRKTVILKGDLILLPVPSVASYPGEILEYAGADKSSATNPKIMFRQWSTGETLEYAIQNNQVTIGLGGKAFKVQLINPAIRDTALRVDFDSDGTLDVPNLKNLFYKNAGVAGSGGCSVGSGWCYNGVILLEGEYKTLFNDSYEIELVYVDANTAKFSVNGEITSNLPRGDSFNLKDHSVLTVTDILYQAYAGGVHSATFTLSKKS